MSFDQGQHILQRALRVAPWMQDHTRRLPGISPLHMPDWLQVDECYVDQLTLKAHLLALHRDQVHILPDTAMPAAQELLDIVLDQLRARSDFEVAERVTRPDGATVNIDRGAPLITLAHLVQEDMIIMMQDGAEHRLAAGLLCFPASWTLREKFDRPLTSIHSPVPEYTGNIARRVQRLFDAIRAEHPLWRANALWYRDPQLFQPRREDERRPAVDRPAPYMRSERQSLLRLPRTGAVVFSIHTSVVHRDDLTEEQQQGVCENPVGEAPQ